MKPYHCSAFAISADEVFDDDKYRRLRRMTIKKARMLMKCLHEIMDQDEEHDFHCLESTSSTI